MSDTVKIVTETTYLYIIIDDILKSLGHHEHPSCECSDSEVITSDVYLDSGFTEYRMEDDVKEAGDVNFFVARKKNSKRPHHASVDFLISCHRKPSKPISAR